jgi:hypothetical protein
LQRAALRAAAERVIVGGQMRVSISRGVRGSEIDSAIPGRYSGLPDAVIRRNERLTVLVFPDDHVVTSSDVARALKRLNDDGDTAVAFMGDATVEALTAFQGAGVRTFSLRSFGWTDERYAAIRQPRSHDRDRGPGGLPK